MRAIKAGVTYANMHPSKFPGGEIRGQIRRGHGEGHDQRQESERTGLPGTVSGGSVPFREP